MSAPQSTPHHIAIIMDGNGRWATRRGLPKIAGHRAGVVAAQRIIEAAASRGVKILTLYTFSTENWKRPEHEVSALFGLIEEYVDREADRLHKNNIRLNVIGRFAELPESVRTKLGAVMAKTAHNTALTVNLALNYGGRTEILDACRSIARDVQAGKIVPDAITEELFSSRLYTAGLPDPDLMIRTSGEFRISNYLLWQLSYAELYITESLWPDFGESDLAEAIEAFRKRERRYGR